MDNVNVDIVIDTLCAQIEAHIFKGNDFVRKKDFLINIFYGSGKKNNALFDDNYLYFRCLYQNMFCNMFEQFKK